MQGVLRFVMLLFFFAFNSGHIVGGENMKTELVIREVVAEEKPKKQTVKNAANEALNNLHETSLSSKDHEAARADIQALEEIKNERKKTFHNIVASYLNTIISGLATLMSVVLISWISTKEETGFVEKKQTLSAVKDFLKKQR